MNYPALLGRVSIQGVFEKTASYSLTNFGTGQPGRGSHWLRSHACHKTLDYPLEPGQF